MLFRSGESYFQIFQSILESTPSTRKTILVIDEVYLAFKQGEMLLEALKQLWEENRDKNNLMLILASSSVQWVENNMVKMLGSFALYFDEIKKLRHFGFLEIVNRYPELTSRDDVYVYGVLGGVPGYMDLWNPKESIRENIIRLFLDKNALLYNEPSRFLKSELRELAFYNTILSNLASGRQKLNQLYERTGFSRAKISVYLKNLIQLDVVEKVFSYDATNRDSVQKGLYGIKDPLLDFWYEIKGINRKVVPLCCSNSLCSSGKALH